jgi:hypothetical protein
MPRACVSRSKRTVRQPDGENQAQATNDPAK